jgi:hypothetical protein
MRAGPRTVKLRRTGQRWLRHADLDACERAFGSSHALALRAILWTPRPDRLRCRELRNREARMRRHLTLEELEAGLPEILASPKDEGTLCAIVIRPAKGERCDLETCEISLELGAHGDQWAKGCWN